MSFLAPLLVVTAVGHGTALLCRRRRLGLVLALVASTVTWALTVSWLFFLDTTWLLAPHARRPGTPPPPRCARSWAAFNQVDGTGAAPDGLPARRRGGRGAGGLPLRLGRLPPVVGTRGPRRRPSRCSCSPPLLAADRQRVASAVLFTAAALCFLVAHRVARLERSGGWVTAERSRGARSLLRVGLALVAVAVVARRPRRAPPAGSGAVGAGPVAARRGLRLLPGHRQPARRHPAPPRHAERGGGLHGEEHASPPTGAWPPSTSSTASTGTPRSPTPRPTAGTSPPPRGSAVTSCARRFTLENLDSPWLPAAYQPTRLDQVDVKVKYDAHHLRARSPTAPRAERRDLRRDLDHPRPDPRRAAQRRPPTSPPTSAATDLALPAGFSPTGRGLARQVTRRARPTPTTRPWPSRTGSGPSFTYTPRRPAGPRSPIDNFLPEQAGLLRAVRRDLRGHGPVSLGIPARVAVGFTWGEAAPATRRRYTVRGDERPRLARGVPGPSTAG